MEFDEAVDGFGAAVGGAGVEVGQERLLPLAQGPAQAGDLGDRAGGESGEDALGDRASFGLVGVLVGGAQLLGALPGQDDDLVLGAGGERPLDPGALFVGEVLGAGAQDGLDPVERVALAAAVTVQLLLPDGGTRPGRETDPSPRRRRAVPRPWRS